MSADLFKSLCAELVEKIGYTWGNIPEDVGELIASARAALAAEPVGATPLSLAQLLRNGYEPREGLEPLTDGAQQVDCEWWEPMAGCDSLQSVVDNARRYATQAAQWA